MDAVFPEAHTSGTFESMEAPTVTGQDTAAVVPPLARTASQSVRPWIALASQIQRPVGPDESKGSSWTIRCNQPEQLGPK